MDKNKKVIAIFFVSWLISVVIFLFLPKMGFVPALLCIFPYLLSYSAITSDDYRTSNPRHQDIDRIAKSSLGKRLIDRTFWLPNVLSVKHIVVFAILIVGLPITVGFYLRLLSPISSIYFIAELILCVSFMGYAAIAIVSILELFILQMLALSFIGVALGVMLLIGLYVTLNNTEHAIILTISLVFFFYLLSLGRFIYNNS